MDEQYDYSYLIHRLKRYSPKSVADKFDRDFADAITEAAAVIDELSFILRELND